jgi:superfamily II DNA/RNA helicase
MKTLLITFMISIVSKRSGTLLVKSFPLQGIRNRGNPSQNIVSVLAKETRAGKISFIRHTSLHNLDLKRCMSLRATSPDDTSLASFLADATSTDDFFASKEMFPTFESIGIQNPILLERVSAYLNRGKGEDCRPSAVQAAAFTAINSGTDVTIGAETGSGKTLAYLLPLMDDILTRKQKAKTDSNTMHRLGYVYARAIILVPNKELANQVLRMAMELSGGQASVVWGSSGEQYNQIDDKVDGNEIIRLGILPGGLNVPEDYKPFRLSVSDSNHPPLDLVITTPASLSPLALSPKNIELFADVSTLVIDEADMLFDGGYLKPLENVLMGFRRADRLDSSFGVQKTQHVLVAATLPDMGLKSVDAYVQKKFPYATRVTMKGMHNARHYGLKGQNVWIEDNFDDEMPKRRRMDQLINMFSPESSSDTSLIGEKVMIFLNSIDDVDSATAALSRNGIDAVSFHAKLSLEERTENLNRFRKYTAYSKDNESDAVPILVCTDLAARGLDIPGVTSVVQLQFAGNVVTHLHRMGRCGRAGKRDGRGIIFYGGTESELVNVVRQAEKEQITMVLKSNEIEYNEEQTETGGKVQNAFSRKRGFTKKRKKIARKDNSTD